MKRNVVQEWVQHLSLMQQTVLLTGIRGPDGIPKYGSIKMILRWFRRCVLISAMDGVVLSDPIDPRGGSFTGPSVSADGPWPGEMGLHVDEYIRLQDSLPFHFQMHLMHSAEILGYKHPDPQIRGWWYTLYTRLVSTMHLHPETEEQLDVRLGDSYEDWKGAADPATLS